MRDKNNRKDIATRVDADLKVNFQIACKANNHTMSEVLESFMDSYIKKEYKLVKQVKYKLKKVSE